MDRKFFTPMMQQYQEIKKKYGDCILFFRMGDFYEMFLDDAKIGTEVLGITLTKRSKGRDGDVPMAGVPYHAIDAYLPKLVKVGYKVAICEQTSVPDGSGLVNREVVRVVTPGTVLGENSLNQRQNNYLVSVAFFVPAKQDAKRNSMIVGLGVVDLSTGDLQATEFEGENWDQMLKDELARLRPSECILSDEFYNNINVLRVLKSYSSINIYPFKGWNEYSEGTKKRLKDYFQVKSLSGFGLESKLLAQEAVSTLLGYLLQTQKQKVGHIKSISSYGLDNYLVMDRSTIINLELFSTIREREKKGSLINLLDRTNTAMGARMLRQWMAKPLVDGKKIQERLDVVEEILKFGNVNDFRYVLKRVSDIERIVSRLSVGIGNARDLVQLRYSLEACLELNNLLHKSKLNLFKNELLKRIDEFLSGEMKRVVDLVKRKIQDEPPVDVRRGRMICFGVSKELDELREVMGGGKKWMVDFEKRERERTGIQSIKVKFNKVFGFYIEVSKANLHLVPDDYIRKQTLVNAERFITSELKKQEEIVLSAEEKIVQLEYEIFVETVNSVLEEVEVLQKVARGVAELDCLVNFTYLSEQYSYCKPEILQTGELMIENGRHPMVEQLLEDKQFVPNDCIFGENKRLMLITGPNMAGKSVYIRQVAIIVLMAQMGCFVPAEKMKMGLCDQIFVRSGAADVITMGLSTFMVEMVETAHILNHATDRSLVVMDEIGRGTSTYDGVSIAWAVVEYLVSAKFKIKNEKLSGPKTLFATHYHELQVLADQYSDIENHQMAVEERDGEPIFLHKIVPGGASHSYGIAVAKLAGVPRDVLRRAVEVLNSLEDRSVETPSHRMAIESSEQLSFLKNEDHPVMKQLRKMEVDSMTPMEALQKLAEWKKEI